MDLDIVNWTIFCVKDSYNFKALQRRSRIVTACITLTATHFTSIMWLRFPHFVAHNVGKLYRMNAKFTTTSLYWYIFTCLSIKRMQPHTAKAQLRVTLLAHHKKPYLIKCLGHYKCFLVELGTVVEYQITHACPIPSHKVASALAINYLVPLRIYSCELQLCCTCCRA